MNLRVFLKEHVGDVLRLEFGDGHVVIGRLITVDLDEPAELIYDVLEVLAVGPIQLAGVRPGMAAAAAVAELTSASMAEAPNL